MFVEDEAEIASRIGGTERGVLDFGKLLGQCVSPMSRNSVLEALRVRRFAVIQEEIC